jgi:hypothetical protein
MLLPQMLNDFISTTISIPQTLGTANDRTDMKARLGAMDLILMTNTIGVASEALRAGGV